MPARNFYQLLLEHKASPTQQRHDQMTPITAAIFYGHVDVVKLLYRHNVNITEDLNVQVGRNGVQGEISG